MKKDLTNNFGASNVHVLYDQPHQRFKPLSQSEKDDFIGKVSESYPLLDKIKSGDAKLIVSSTSWTKDEDFSILLDALGMEFHISELHVPLGTQVYHKL